MATKPYLYPSAIPFLLKDTALRKYTFILRPQSDATVGEDGICCAEYPMFGQVAIIDNKDTVRLEIKNKQIKRKFMGFKWKYTIRD